MINLEECKAVRISANGVYRAILLSPIFSVPMNDRSNDNFTVSKPY